MLKQNDRLVASSRTGALVFVGLAMLALAGACARAGGTGTVGGPGVEPPEPESRVFTFQPDTATYLVTTRRVITQEITGQPQEVRTSLVYRLAAELTPMADSGLGVALRVDSLVEASIPGVGRAAAGEVVGSTFRARLLPTGRLTDFGDVGASPLSQAIANTVRQFFPPVPTDGVEDGETWVDTTETIVETGTSTITVAAIVRSRAGVWSETDGLFVLPVEWTSRYTLSGEGEQVGQPFVLEGDGERTGSYRLGADGRFLGAVARDSSSALITVSNLGLTIPLLQSGADTVLIVP